MNNSKLKQIFENLISLVEEKKWYGACHDISAVFYILAKEVGFEPTLLIGEVRNPATGSYFDHSWVCIDEKIYDVAIGYPNHGIDRGLTLSGTKTHAKLSLRVGACWNIDHLP
ncbi:hypothetical protein ACND5D_003610 [Escherichia coli]